MRALPRFQIPVNISLMKDDKTKTPDKPKLQVSQIGWIGKSWGAATVLAAGSVTQDIGFI